MRWPRWARASKATIYRRWPGTDEWSWTVTQLKGAPLGPPHGSLHGDLEAIAQNSTSADNPLTPGS